MNVPFCLWLWNRAKVSNDEIDLMVHEPFLPFGEGSWKQQAAAAVHRIMATIILNAAMRVWMSIPAWEDRLRPYLLGRRIPMEWLPVPSSVESDANPGAATGYMDREIVRGRVVLGHFGTYGSAISNMLQSLVLPLLQDHPNRVLVLMGRGSTEFRSRMVAQNRSLSDQIEATGEITSAALSTWIARCDIMIQPYPDGISSRRTTAMVALSRAVPIVTTIGPLTENVWEESGAVRLVPTNDMIAFVNAVNELLSDDNKRTQIGMRGKELYLNRFDVSHTIQALRRAFHNLTSCSATAVY
jgi:glycosyltransferase involved in cell wall biosynthesis